MITYHGSYSSKLGRASILGQDAVIQPITPPPPAAPSPLPFGSGAAGGPTPLPQGSGQPVPVVAPTPVPVVPAPSSPGGTVTIAGRQIPIWTIVGSGLIVLGGVALVAFTKSDIDGMFSGGRTRKKK